MIAQDKAKRIRGEVSKPTWKLSEGLSLVSRGEEMRVSYADGCRHITRNASRESNPAALNKRALKVRQLMCSGKEVEWNSGRDSRNLSEINVPQALQLDEKLKVGRVHLTFNPILHSSPKSWIRTAM